MKLPVGHEKSRKEYWINHIESAETFDGTLKKYCQLHGLKMGSMSSYRTKLGYSTKSKKKIKKSEKFIPIKVFSAQPQKLPALTTLPDPKWLAQFLKAWSIK